MTSRSFLGDRSVSRRNDRPSSIIITAQERLGSIREESTIWQSPHCLSSAGAPSLPGSSGPGPAGVASGDPKGRNEGDDNSGDSQRLKS